MTGLEQANLHCSWDLRENLKKTHQSIEMEILKALVHRRRPGLFLTCWLPEQWGDPD